jgi:hypothetical protein
MKRIYLIWSPEKLDRAAFNSAVLGELAPRLLSLDPTKPKISLTEPKPPRLTVLPLKRTGLALLSVWDELERPAEQWRDEIASLGGDVAGYRVSESVPVAYQRNWADGQPSPGAVLLTLMKKNAKLSYEQFMAEWFGKHTPMAVEIHPLWNYIRNVVDSVEIEGSPPFDGIVEEHFRTLSDITRPWRMFGGKLKMVRNMVRVGRHANKFLSLSETENYILTEYHLRS